MRRKRFTNPGKGLEKALDDVEISSAAVVKAAARLSDARDRVAYYRRRIREVEEGVKPVAVRELVAEVDEEHARKAAKMTQASPRPKVIDIGGGLTAEIVEGPPEPSKKSKPKPKVKRESPRTGEAHAW